MGDSKFYTKKMRIHCKEFFLGNFEKLETKYSEKYSTLYPDLYQSSQFQNTTLFDFISDSLIKGIDSDYTIYRDNDLIDNRLNFRKKNEWKKILEEKYYLESEYIWYYFSPIDIPIKIRELVVDKFDLLEEFYKQSIESHLKRFYIRGRVKEKWINLDLLYKNGFNKYLNQFNRFGQKPLNKLKSELLNYTEAGIYGLLNNADLYALFIDDNGNKHNIQLLKFEFNNNVTNVPILVNFFINYLKLIPTQYLINKNLLDIYLEEENKPINFLRNRLGLPKIGEGWISETKLFYQLKDEFSNQVVIQHSKTKWLGRQHFDIYFPFLNIAIEYQGKQHFESVEYFGGNEAFKQNQIRDKRKRELAKINNCDLIYVEPGYEIHDIVSKIRS